MTATATTIQASRTRARHDRDGVVPDARLETLPGQTHNGQAEGGRAAGDGLLQRVTSLRTVVRLGPLRSFSTSVRGPRPGLTRTRYERARRDVA